MVCRALRPLGLFADQIRRLEWWDVGVLLDGDLGPPPPRIVVPAAPRDPDKPRGPRLSAVD